MQSDDYEDNLTTQRTTWIAENGEFRFVPHGAVVPQRNLQKKIDTLCEENDKILRKLNELRIIVERGLGCKFTYEYIKKPFGIGQMSGECIDAYNTLQQIVKDYDKMFGGDHVTDASKDWVEQ